MCRIPCPRRAVGMPPTLKITCTPTSNRIALLRDIAAVDNQARLLLVPAFHTHGLFALIADDSHAGGSLSVGLNLPAIAGLSGDCLLGSAIQRRCWAGVG